MCCWARHIIKGSRIMINCYACCVVLVVDDVVTIYASLYYKSTSTRYICYFYTRGSCLSPIYFFRTVESLFWSIVCPSQSTEASSQIGWPRGMTKSHETPHASCLYNHKIDIYNIQVIYLCIFPI
jgi:hypothetical protein